MPALIIKPRLILVTHTDDLGLALPGHPSISQLRDVSAIYVLKPSMQKTHIFYDIYKINIKTHMIAKVFSVINLYFKNTIF